MWSFFYFDYVPRKEKEVQIWKEKAKNIVEPKREKEDHRTCELPKAKTERQSLVLYRPEQNPNPRRSSDTPRLNRVRGLGGYGPLGLEVSGSSINVKRGPIFGLGYDRLFTNYLSLGVEVFSNGQVNGSVGWDF